MRQATPAIGVSDLWTKDAGGPQPWLTETGGSPNTPLEWYLDALREFLAAAYAGVADCDSFLYLDYT